jgi:hypothetical protein
LASTPSGMTISISQSTGDAGGVTRHLLGFRAGQSPGVQL